jgi:ketosteroid isomerase-like protein
MKKNILLLITVFFTFTGFAQSKKHDQVAAAVEKLRLAMISGVKSELEAIADDSLSYGHSGGAVEGKSDFVEKIASGKSDFVTIDLSEQTISVYGNVAVVRHRLYAKNNDGGKPGEVKLKILLVFKKAGNNWKLLARQAVKLT